MAFDKGKESKSILTGHFVNLYNLALIDHKLHEDELNFLYKLGDRHGFSRADVRDVINNASNISYSPPTTALQKVEVLYDLVSMMIVDGKLDEREAMLCNHLAKEMGLKSQIVGEVVNILVSGQHESIDENQLRKDLFQLASNL